MGRMLSEIIQGRKTFFIAPDKSLLPLSYLEEYLSLGYECYFIDNDIFLPLEKKIQLILSTFKDSILFFNIDFPLLHGTWFNLISKMKKIHKDALFGVLYNKRQSQTERTQIEYTYLYLLELQCGCIQLEYQKKNNFGIIEKVLYANQATGRRRNVRAICTTSCTFHLKTPGGETIQGKLNDISLTHFSFTIPKGLFEIPQYSRIRDINFTIRGTHFRSDAVMFMKRETDEGDLFVFAFSQENGGGISPLNRKLIVPKLYEIMSSNCHELLSRLFTAASHSGTKTDIAEIINAAESMEDIDREDKKEEKEKTGNAKSASENSGTEKSEKETPESEKSASGNSESGKSEAEDKNIVSGEAEQKDVNEKSEAEQND